MIHPGELTRAGCALLPGRAAGAACVRSPCSSARTAPARPPSSAATTYCIACFPGRISNGCSTSTRSRSRWVRSATSSDPGADRAAGSDGFKLGVSFEPHDRDSLPYRLLVSLSEEGSQPMVSSLYFHFPGRFVCGAEATRSPEYCLRDSRLQGDRRTSTRNRLDSRWR